MPDKQEPQSNHNAQQTLRTLIEESKELRAGERIAGVFNYEAGYVLEGAFHQLDVASSRPALHAAVYHWYIQPHTGDSVEMILSERCHEDVVTKVRQLLSDTAHLQWQPEQPEFELTEFLPDEPQQPFEKKVSKILDYILAGDCYQVNLSQRFQAQYQGNPWPAYTHLTEHFPTGHAAYLSFGEEKILSISPESFLETHQRQMVTRPIKGTRPRGKTPDQDLLNANELLNSPKDRAENIMIVDLLRNDLGRFCTPGSITAHPLLELESYRNVHHLVSTVTGELEKDIPPLSALALAFPGGSITGAPKIRAMEIIRELEPFPRGPYCGSVFSLDHNGSLYSNIAIRTLYTQGDSLFCHGGGGIVSDSCPEAEYQETLDKVQPLMNELTRTFGRNRAAGERRLPGTQKAEPGNQH